MPLFEIKSGENTNTNIAELTKRFGERPEKDLILDADSLHRAIIAWSKRNSKTWTDEGGDMYKLLPDFSDPEVGYAIGCDLYYSPDKKTIVNAIIYIYYKKPNGGGKFTDEYDICRTVITGPKLKTHPDVSDNGVYTLKYEDGQTGTRNRERQGNIGDLRPAYKDKMEEVGKILDRRPGGAKKDEILRVSKRVVNAALRVEVQAPNYEI